MFYDDECYVRKLSRGRYEGTMLEKSVAILNQMVKEGLTGWMTLNEASKQAHHAFFED